METKKFIFWVEESGDSSVGIPPAYGRVSLEVPAWLVLGDDAEQDGYMNSGMVDLLKGFIDRGHVLTDTEKKIDDARFAESNIPE